MTVAIGVDVGTSGARAVAVDEGGRILSSATSSYPLLTPRPQWTEQDPIDWWAGVSEALGAVARQVAEGGRRVSGLGLTGQMHGSVFLDAAGEVIRPALLWNDQRTGKQCQEITERVGPQRIVEITGNPALTGFQAPKVLWLREEEPASYERVARVLLPKDYIRYRLTGGFATDASDAAGTLFMDLGRRAWSTEVLEALEVPSEWLPIVHEAPETTGVVRKALAAELGLPDHLPVAAGGGDNAGRRSGPRSHATACCRARSARAACSSLTSSGAPSTPPAGSTRSATPSRGSTASWRSRCRPAGPSGGGAT